jgi:hypothetical protein
MAVVSTDTNLSAVSYVAGETITIQGGATLTMDATPAVRPGIIQCIRSGKFSIVNPSTTTPLVLESDSYLSDLRFEGNGVLETRGNMIEIGVGDGTYKSWDFSTLFSGAYTSVTLVEVEITAGSGNYKPWRIVDITPRYFHSSRLTVGSSSAEKTMFDAEQDCMFWNDDTKVIDTGDGTNGKVIPNGCKVRIPNILLTNQFHYQDACTYRHNLISTGTPTGGTFTITIQDRYAGTTLGTTSALNHNATAAQVDTAIEAVIGAGTVSVTTGPLPAAIIITQTGAYATYPLSFQCNSSVTGGTNSLIFTRVYNHPDLQLLDLNASGAADLECTAFGRNVYTANTAFSLARMVHVGCGTSLYALQNANGSIELDHFSFTQNGNSLGATSSISDVAGEVKLNKVVVSSGANSASNYATLPNLTRFEDVEAHRYGTGGTTSSYGINIAAINNVDLIRLINTGGRFLLSNASNINIINPKTADDAGTVQRTVNNGGFIMNNCLNVVISNLRKIGTCAPRSSIFNPDAASSNIQIIGGEYDCSDNTAALTTPSGNTTIIVGFKATNMRTGPLVDLPTAFTSKNTQLRKVLMTQSVGVDGLVDSGQDNQYDLVSCSILGFNPANSAVENFIGGNFTDMSLTPTTGHVTFGAFGRGSSMVQTGSTYTDQIGSIYMPMNGDTAEVTMPFSMHGITSFQNVAPRLIGESLGGKAGVWRVMNDGGVTGGTFTITVYDSSGALIGTTTALTYNASATTIDNALGVVTGSAGNHTVAGDLLAGWIITFLATYGDGVYTLTVDGSLLTGGTKPGTAEARGIPSRRLGEEFGSGLTTEYAVKTPSGSYGAWTTLTGANLAGAISALSGYDEADGLDMRLKFTATGDDDYRRVQVVTMPTNVDVTTYTPSDSTITLNGPSATDLIHVYDIADDTELYTLTGGGLQNFATGSNYGKSVYFTRESSTGKTLMTTYPNTKTLVYGSNGEVNLYYGDEIQLAHAEDYVKDPTFPNYLDLGGLLKPL